MLCTLITVFAAAAVHAQPAPAHALEGTLRSLSKISIELEAAQSSSKDEKEQLAIGRIKEKAAALWSEAALVPVKTTDALIRELGYDIVLLNPTPQYNLVKNQKYTELMKNAYAMNLEPWSKLSQAVVHQMDAVRAIGTMVADTAYTDGVSAAARQAVATGAGNDRLNQLQTLKEISNAQLGCIRYFSGKFASSGLRPEGKDESVHWSADELSRIWGVRDFSQIPNAQKTAVRSALSEMMTNLNRFDAVCVSDDVAAFLEKQQQAVGQ